MTGPLGPLGRPGPHALLGGALVTGWVLHDLVVFLTSGEPALAAGLVPTSLALILLGALAGALLHSWRWTLAAAASTLAVALAVRFAPELLPISWSEPRAQLVRALAALLLAATAAALLVERTRLGPVRAGLALGALGGPLLALLSTELASSSVAFALGATLFLAAGFRDRPRARRALSTLATIFALLPAALLAFEQGALQRADLAPGPAAPGGPRPNVLLVVLDTVRADRLAPYGYGRVTTPGLDALVEQRALVYTNARSTSSWTLPSHASLFTGLFPAAHGATHPRGARDDSTVTHGALPAQPLRGDVPTLAELLRAAGYRTGAVLANNAYLDPRFGLDRGFEHYDSRPGGLVGEYLPLAQLAWQPVRAGRQLYRDARTITDLALRWLARAPSAAGGRPFFLAVNYMDAHAPYLPPPPFDAAFGEPVVAEPWRLRHEDRSLLYDRALLFLDSELCRLLAGVDFERTVVIVTADHGESLGDHGYWMHSWTLYEDVVHVPLYVMRPGVPPGERAEPVTGVDVFELALLGLGVERGQDRPTGDGTFGEWYQLKETPRAQVLADKHVQRDLIGWLEGTRKFIVSSTGEVEAYDLARDPRELEPLALEAGQLEAARARAADYWRAHPRLETGDAGQLDAAELERMRKLGYLDGDS